MAAFHRGSPRVGYRILTHLQKCVTHYSKSHEFGEKQDLRPDLMGLVSQGVWGCEKTMGKLTMRNLVLARVKAKHLEQVEERASRKKERQEEDRQRGKVREPRKRTPRPRLPSGRGEPVVFYVPE